MSVLPSTWTGAPCSAIGANCSTPGNLFFRPNQKSNPSCFHSRDIQGCLEGMHTPKTATAHPEILYILLCHSTHNLHPGRTDMSCAVLRCAVLCCAVLCCAVLCCAVLCCAMLCCAVLGVLAVRYGSRYPATTRTWRKIGGEMLRWRTFSP